MIQSTYRTLIAWQRAIQLVLDVYEVSSQFPDHERFALTQQMRRAALSAPANIAEGRGRGTKRDFRHFLLQARGSLYETETLAEVAQRLGYINEASGAELRRKTSEVIRPLNGLIRSLSVLPARRSP